MRQEVHSLLAKGVIERVPPRELEVLQPPFSGDLERWGTLSDPGPETHHPSTSQAPIQDDDAKSDPDTDSSQGLVFIYRSERVILPYSDSTVPQTLSLLSRA